MDKKVLLLNASEEVLSVISWIKGVNLICNNKVRAPYGHDETYDIRTSGGIFKLPTALVLVKYVRVPYKNLPVTRQNLMKRDKNKCQYCGKHLTGLTSTIDHVIPQSKGGKNVWRNVVLACMPCNNEKDNKTPKQAGMTLLSQPQTPNRIVLLVMTIDLMEKPKWKRWLNN